MTNHSFSDAPRARPDFDVAALTRVFQREFESDTQTRLVGGASEPLYQPARDTSELHTIYFTHDYFASALHEAAHWCIAGDQRRGLVDYGYWYLPDGRTAEQQAVFEQVEVRPQALEWIFCRACAYPFRVSADNLNAGTAASWEFKQAILRQVRNYCEGNLPTRAARFARALQREFGGCDFTDPSAYTFEDLQ